MYNMLALGRMTETRVAAQHHQGQQRCTMSHFCSVKSEVIVHIYIPMPTSPLHDRGNDCAVTESVSYSLPRCRSRIWFWDSVLLWQTLALASAQVLATSLDAYFQLTIMLAILVVGLVFLTYLRPFEAPVSQFVQVCFSSFWHAAHCPHHL